MDDKVGLRKGTDVLLELADLGDVMVETKQSVVFPIIPDFYYGWGDWY